MSTAGIDYDDLELLLLELLDAIPCDHYGIRLCERSIVRDLCFRSILFQLIERTSSECIGAYKTRFETSRLVPSRKLGATRRLSRSL